MHGALLYYLIKQSHHPTVHSWGVGTKLCLGLQWCTTVQYYLDDMEVIRGIMIPEKWRLERAQVEWSTAIIHAHTKHFLIYYLLFHDE
jgi:hypothetical protein